MASDDNNAGAAFKPVHFREQLAEGLFVPSLPPPIPAPR